MKTIKTNILLALLFMLTTAMSCSDDDLNTNGNDVAAIVSIVNQGTWAVSYYYDRDHEETNGFAGFTFTFEGNNTVTATNGTNTYKGTWSVTDENSNDDSPNDLDFNLAFTSPAQFLEISDDWEIIEKSATVLKLKDVSGGNGGTDFLTFTKK
ncbi:hypothetical protein L1S34_14195 [Flavobacterium sp. K77]|uniref:hypothetical protein n=1 Tax=Flavobacterium sp. K77 TaxID=2910676 RepID=UPI001F31D47E|nr:hypothetical protein [Flavobacterium sp. K77]MCF6142443.1 hypothetical protein [Flavobacterium sp. K77]